MEEEAPDITKVEHAYAVVAEMSLLVVSVSTCMQLIAVHRTDSTLCSLLQILAATCTGRHRDCSYL